ncbi:MAG: hypothetical protein P8P83_03040 [Rickettsiaceae bacterium]|nr:hypothetical protein [Rickettsiaceae bacterium]
MNTNFSQFFCILAALVFVFSFVHIIHFRLFNTHIVLNAILVDIVLTCCIILLICIAKKTDGFVIFSSTITFTLFAVIYAVLIPTMVDRSISVDLLTALAVEPSGTMSASQLEKAINMDDVLDKRFDEQVHTGLMSKTIDGRLKITNKGKFVASVFILNSKVLNIDINKHKK